MRYELFYFSFLIFTFLKLIKSIDKLDDCNFELNYNECILKILEYKKKLYTGTVDVLKKLDLQESISESESVIYKSKVEMNKVINEEIIKKVSLLDNKEWNKIFLIDKFEKSFSNSFNYSKYFEEEK